MARWYRQLITDVFGRPTLDGESRFTIDDWAAAKAFVFQGMKYPMAGINLSGSTEEVEQSFIGYVQSAYKACGPVFATSVARMLLFTEARFLYQRMRSGRPTDLFSTPDLDILDKPWPNGGTGELLARMEQDVTLAGNFYAARTSRSRIRRLRPDWVEIILSAPPDEAVESDVEGYRYTPGGPYSRATPIDYLPEQVCHWSPIPDPEAQYRGMSWLTPVVNEVLGDKAATRHKIKFYESGGTPQYVVRYPPDVTEDQFKEHVEDFKAHHPGGIARAYQTLFLAGGADISVVGADLKQLDFKITQGAGETRITAAGSVPAIIVGLSEGLESATYSNYGMARRKFGDHWARPQWRSAANAVRNLVPVPADARLWYDDRDIPFLREDQKDEADIFSTKANALRALLDAGYTPESSKLAVETGDFSVLEHSGLFSVQLQPPGEVSANDPGDGTDPTPDPPADPAPDPEADQ